MNKALRTLASQAIGIIPPEASLLGIGVISRTWAAKTLKRVNSTPTTVTLSDILGWEKGLVHGG